MTVQLPALVALGLALASACGRIGFDPEIEEPYTSGDDDGGIHDGDRGRLDANADARLGSTQDASPLDKTSCAEPYGTAPGYVLCAATIDSCTFEFQAGPGAGQTVTCAELCPGSCQLALDVPTSGCNELVIEVVPCTQPLSIGRCLCAK